jgi:hypothetical protein
LRIVLRIDLALNEVKSPDRLVKDMEINSMLDPQSTSPLTQPDNASTLSPFRRAIGLWPYLLIIISVTGLAYIAFSATR